MRATNLSPPNPMSTVYSILRHPHVERERLEAFRNERLRGLVAHAYRQVPYYRDLFDRHGLKPHDIRTVEDLAVVPISSRSDLQALPAEEITAQYVKPESLITRSSSGSSGRPFLVRRTWVEERIHGIVALRALHALGLRIRDKTCNIVRPQNVQLQDHQTIQGILAMLGIGRQIFVNALQSPEEIVHALEKLKASVLSGYAGVLARIAQTVDGENLRSLRLRYVNTGGEVLTPLMRHQIGEGFGVPVYDTYGSIEFHLLAWECRTTGEYHACDDGLILEVLRNGVPVVEGERGEVVGTDLHSFAMPLIRYKLGDVVTRGRQICRCREPFSTIRSIQGRMNDYFVLPNNKFVHPYELGVVKVPWIREFQVTQERMDSIVMKVVPFYRPTTQETASFIQTVIEIIGPEVEFRVEVVPAIPMEANGKFRVFRSHVRSAYDGLVWSEKTEEAPSVHHDLE